MNKLNSHEEWNYSDITNINTVIIKSIWYKEILWQMN